MWKCINQQVLCNPNNIDLNTFKSSKTNFNISLWNPKKNGVRYLKTLLYTLLSTSSTTDFELYKKIKNRNIGSPITVKIRGEEICLDYFQAIDEAKTISKAVSLNGAKILEIGSGYGRTCHTFLCLYPEIESYCVLDLEPCLILSKRYLEAVLSTGLFSKIRFIGIQDFECLQEEAFDLAINIDGMADMQEETVLDYLKYIDGHCNGFYCKNTVGKYLDKSLDGSTDYDESVEIALNSGILREIIDIFDGEQIDRQTEIFLEAYCPSTAWECVSHGPAPPWSFYHQAVYKNRGIQVCS